MLDRSQETFTVPPTGTNYYVNDASTVGDQYTTAVGSNRNTGKTPGAPLPNPDNVLRQYQLGAGSVLYIDTGSYSMIDPVGRPIRSASQDVSLVGGPGLSASQGFTITGPRTPPACALLYPAIPGNQTLPLIYIDAANNMTIEHLSLDGGNRGLYVFNGSSSFDASYITAYGNLLDGINISSAAPFSDFDNLVAYDNGATGITINGPIGSLTNSSAYDNAGIGFDISGALNAASGNTAYGNTGWGFYFTSPGAALITSSSSFDNQAGGIYVYSGNGVVVGDANLADGKGNLVYDNVGYGIEVYYGPSTVAGNTVYGQTATNDWGIYGYDDVNITSNVVYGNYQGIEDYYSGAVDTNRVYGNANDGIYTYGSAAAGNVVYGNALGMSLNGDNSTTFDTANNNVVYDNSQVGVFIGGTDFIFINNTVDQLVGDAVQLNNASKIGLYNNILGSAGGGYALDVSANSQTGFQSDYNLFMPIGALGSWQGTGDATLTAWRSASGTDVNSLVADPGFLNAATGDFHEQSQYGGFVGGSGLAPELTAGDSLPVLVAPALSTTETTQSPTIDRGRAGDSYALEPAPNGGYINIGAYGDTAQAGESPSQYITILSPSGGERIGQGSTVTIDWRSFGFTGNVNISYEGGSVSSFTTLAANVANSGSYTWTVAAGTFATGTNYELQIGSVSAPSIIATTAPFSVVLPIHYYYVNGASTGGQYTTAGGNDANDGLSPDQPKATLQALLAAGYHFNAGDIIYVDTGTYTLGTNIVLTAADDGVTIEGSTAPGDATIFNRGNTNAGAYVFELDGATGVTLENLNITGGDYGVYADTWICEHARHGGQQLCVRQCCVRGVHQHEQRLLHADGHPGVPEWTGR